MWFNPACYVPSASGTRGNAKRNSLRGPDLRLLDMALVKTTAISAGYQAQVRFEVFNVLNRANFDLPANTTDGETIYSCPCTFDAAGKPVQKQLPDAGKIFQTVTDGRSFQLALRLLF